METPLRVLIVEDSEDDAELVLRQLRLAGYDPRFERVQTGDAMRAALERESWDVVVSDYSLPRFDAPGALNCLKESGRDIPFIVVSGTIGEDTAVATLQAGAQDFILKQNLARFIPAVQRELRNAKERFLKGQSAEAKERLQIERDELLGRLKQQNEDLLALTQITANAISTLDLDEMLRVLLGRICEVMQADSATVLLKEGGALRVVARAGVVDLSASPLVREVGEGFVGSIASRMEPSYREDAALDPLTAPLTRERGIRSRLGVPLKHHGALVGVIHVGWLSVRPRRDREVHLLEVTAERCAAAVQNARLHEETIRINAALVESEARFRRVVESNMVGMLFWDSSGAITEANDAFLRIVGFTPEDVRAGRVNWRVMTPPEYRAFDERALRQIEEVGNSEPFEKEYVRKDGSRVPVLIGGASLKNQIGEGVAFVLDISTRKQAENQLRKLSRVVEQAPISIVITNLEGAIEYVNPTFIEVTGYSREEALGRNPRMLKSGLTPLEVYREMWATIGAGKVWRGELHNRKKSGETHLELVVIAPVIESDGRTTHYVALKEDVTREKEAEQEARESAGRFEQLALHVNEVFWMADVEKSRVLYVSPAYEAIWGQTSASLLASPRVWLDAVHPEDREQAAQAALSEQTRDAYDLEYRIVRPDGAVRWIHDRAFPVEDQNGEVYRIVGVASDITERKHAELAAQASEQRLRTLVDFTPGIVWEADARTLVFTSVSRNAERLLGYPEAEWLAPDFWASHIHPEDRASTVESCRACTERSEDHELEFRFIAQDGHLVWLRDIVRVVEESGKPRWLRGLIVDITAARQAQDAVQSSLRDKEALLKEVHHRVKNNLQVINSLLRLETGRSPDPSTRSVLKDMQGRIQAMALLHETLYRSGTFAAVDLAAYLRQLATQSFRALSLRPGSVQLELDLQSVQVEMDQAIPCGLLANELISNCLKHGFPGDRSGSVHVELQALSEGRQVRLRVSDTGAGLAADFDSKRGQTLGLQLASDLARQLGGHLEIEPGPGSGAVFAVTWAAR